MTEREANDLLAEISIGMKHIPFLSYAAVVENPKNKDYFFIEYGLIEKSLNYLYYNPLIINDKGINPNLLEYINNSNIIQPDFNKSMPDFSRSDFLGKDTTYVKSRSSGVKLLSNNTDSGNQISKSDTLRGGISIGNINMKNTGGTLGAFFYSNCGKLYGISNAHVVANHRTKKNEEIYHPSFLDPNERSKSKKIGLLKKWIHDEVMDVAIIEIIQNQQSFSIGTGDTHNLKAFELTPMSIKDLKDNDVEKTGYKSGHSNGKIRSVNASVRIDMNYKSKKEPLVMTNQIMVEKMDVIPGDSGSIICTYNRQAVGVLFAEDEEANRSFFTSFDKILDSKSINLIETKPPFKFEGFVSK